MTAEATDHTGEHAPQIADVIVIGGGIIGLATAWQLLTRSPGSRVTIVEANAEVAGQPFFTFSMRRLLRRRRPLRSANIWLKPSTR